MAHLLKGLVVDEISLVDAPANPGALHVLFKRKDPSMSDADAAAAAAKKAADGPGALERLLTRLGLSKRAPSEVYPETYSDAAGTAIDNATAALSKSIEEILADAAVSDKPAAIAKSMAEFRAYIVDAAAAQIEKAMRDVAIIKTGKDDTVTTEAEQIAALSKQLAETQAELAKAKKMPADDGDADDADAKAKAKAAADAKKKGNPFGKSDDDPAVVALSKAHDEISDLHKRVATFEAERELETFRKRAAQIGVAETQAEVIMKASKGDAESFGKVLEMIKSATAQARTGALFKEFGGSGGIGGVDGSARAEVETAAEVLRKADPTLSVIAARVQIRKTNLELAQRERDEERNAARAAS